jgi:hypothetical protein
MRLKLKENPREWRKFALVWTIAFALATFLFHRRGMLSAKSAALVAPIIAAFFICGMALPRSMRIPYRGVMTISFYVGQFMGRILLTIFFLLLLTPLALLLRLLGKDLLRLKKTPAETFWQKAPDPASHDRMF